jgi:hypothetical protein
MAYDFRKIRATEALTEIVEQIRRQLGSCSAFASNSICYFGIELRYKIDLTLHSRGEPQKIAVGGGRTLGERPDNPNVVEGMKAAAENGEPGEIVTERVEVSDEQLAGEATGERDGSVERESAGIVAPAESVVGGPAGTPEDEAAGTESAADSREGGDAAGPDVGVVEPGRGTAANERAAVRGGKHPPGSVRPKRR